MLDALEVFSGAFSKVQRCRLLAAACTAAERLEMTKHKCPLEGEIYPALPTLTIAYLAARRTNTTAIYAVRLGAHSRGTRIAT